MSSCRPDFFSEWELTLLEDYPAAYLPIYAICNFDLLVRLALPFHVQVSNEPNSYIA